MLNSICILNFSSFIDSIKEIYFQNGLSGFFSGIIPRLIGDLLTVCITTSCTYLIHIYASDDKEIRNYLSAIAGVSNVCTLSLFLTPKNKSKQSNSKHFNFINKNLVFSFFFS